jgi:hypothetical protein
MWRGVLTVLCVALVQEGDNETSLEDLLRDPWTDSLDDEPGECPLLAACPVQVPAARCPLPAARCPLPAACCLLPAACYQLPALGLVSRRCSSSCLSCTSVDAPVVLPQIMLPPNCTGPYIWPARDAGGRPALDNLTVSYAATSRRVMQ